MSSKIDATPASPASGSTVVAGATDAGPRLGPADSIPNTPFGFPIEYQLLQKALDKGEITRKDINTVRHSARWMQGGSILGASTGIPLYFALRRRNPLAPGILAFTASALTMYAGGIGGFTIGAMLAVPWMKRKMTDGDRKVRVFEQLVRDHVAGELEHRAHQEEEFAAKLKGELQSEIKANPS